MKQPLPIFVINLKKDTHKKQHMQQISEELGLEFTFIEAVYGKELDQKEIDKVCDHKNSMELIGRKLFLGEVGVALSQMSIYQKMLDENIENAIIFEDDVLVDESIHEVIDAIPNFPKTWEIVLLGYHRHFISNKFHRLSYRGRKSVSEHFKIVRFTDKMDGAFGYVINLQGAKKLLTILKEGIVRPVDNYTGSDTYINLYGLSPRCVHVDITLESNINPERNAYQKPSACVYQKDSFRRRIKQKMKDIGLLTYIQSVNGLRVKMQERLIHFPKQLERLKKYK